MAAHLRRGVAVTCVNQALVAVVVDSSGLLVDPVSLEFQIYDASTAARRDDPSLAFPGSGRQAVTLTDCPAGHRIGKGRYVAAFTPGVSWPAGRYEIRWYATLTAGAAEVSWSEPFDVIGTSSLTRGSSYALVSSIREQGVPVAALGDARVLESIVRQSRMVERLTGRFFEPRFMSLRASGRGSGTLPLGQPIIGVEQVRISSALDVTVGQATTIDAETIRVYARHLSQGLLSPDDREDPRIAFVTEEDYRLRLASVYFFPEGQQNVLVDGVFGYTDPTSLPASGPGWTPSLIERATELLVLRELPQLVAHGVLDDVQKRWKTLGDRSKGESYDLANPRRAQPPQLAGSLRITDVPEIDAMLTPYLAPPHFGSA